MATDADSVEVPGADNGTPRGFDADEAAIEVEVEETVETRDEDQESKPEDLQAKVRELERVNEALSKSAKDTKAAFHQTRQEIAELKRRLEDRQPVVEPEPDVDLATAIANGTEKEALDRLLDAREQRIRKQHADREQAIANQLQAEWIDLVDADGSVGEFKSEMQQLSGEYPNATLGGLWVRYGQALKDRKNWAGNGKDADRLRREGALAVVNKDKSNRVATATVDANGKAGVAPGNRIKLTKEEADMAKRFGLSLADYAKYRQKSQ